MNSDSDLLSAAGLLLAAESILFAWWFEPLSSQAEQVTPSGVADRKAMRERILFAVVFRAVPLTLLSVAIGFAFLPNALLCVRESLQSLRSSEWAWSVARYDPIATALVLVDVVALLFASGAVLLLVRLIRRRSSISRD